ncbi:phenylalanine--tRNA ligase beta subunit-related protein [Clostridiaceae bacterium 35-E11]
MCNIYISNEIQAICPQITLGCIQAKVNVVDYDAQLWGEISLACEKLMSIYSISEISKIKNIKDARTVYRRLGKDPTRYRISSEALVRRILKDKSLYQVNNIVDINNLISITSFYPICTYDLEKIQEPISFTIGRAGEWYDGIGRGSINIEKLPVFLDKKGEFGSTTSDSERTMVTKDTKYILKCIVSFNGEASIKKHMEQGKKLLEQYADGKDIKMQIISGN